MITETGPDAAERNTKQLLRYLHPAMSLKIGQVEPVVNFAVRLVLY
jgi:hypothetical protein